MTTVRPPQPLRPIDPFTPADGGRYVDDAVTVRRAAGHPSSGLITRTASFALGRDGDRLLLVHDLPDVAIDNDLSGLIARELFEPGWVGGADTFERLLTGVVLTSRAEPLDAWELFYRNTFRALERARTGSAGPGSIAELAPVYRRAEALVRQAGARSVVDLGSCFGFFPIRLLHRPGDVPAVWASDIAPGTGRLLERMASRLRSALRVVTCDAEAVPLESRSVDVVTSLHLLEHVPERQGRRILAEATRLARHRVVVAVPLETVPDPAYGHVRTLTLTSLAADAAAVAPHWRPTVEEFHGGWLTLDRR